MRQLSVYLNSVDTPILGFLAAYGEDEDGNQVHVITIGFLFFAIDLTKYINNENS